MSKARDIYAKALINNVMNSSLKNE